MDWDTLFNLLNMDKESRQSLIDSNPSLKKYFSDNNFKRKPKRLNSPLAKKLEDPKHRLTEQFHSLKDIYKILELEEFDELRKKNYIAEYNEASKIKHPVKKHYRLQQLYSQIQQDIEYFIGQEEKGDSIKDLPLEEQIQQSILAGSKEFKK